jgi:putative ABC transport system permease protein
MPALEILRLAFEALSANKLRSGLTMLGMVIGVGAVVLLVSIGNGARTYITSQFEGLGTNMIIIQPGRTDKGAGFGPPIGSAKEKLTLADVDALERQGLNLEAVSGVMFGAGSIRYEGQEVNGNILGSNERLPRILNIKIGQGEYFSSDAEYGRRVVVLGWNVARALFGEANGLGQLVRVNDSEHRVVGITRKAGSSLGFNMDDMVFVPTKSAMRMFNEDKLFGIRARAKARVSVDDAVEEIRSILKTRHNGEEDFTILTQYAMLGTLNTILGMLTYVLGGIALISMVVGGIGIMNIMLVSVRERTREIGIRRAVGARRTDILRQFLAEAVALSLVGGMLGLAGSVLVTYAITWGTGNFDMRAPAWIMVPAFLLSVGTGVGFGVWPARKAAHTETIEALRFE